jgi:hypothetical protein
MVLSHIWRINIMAAPDTKVNFQRSGKETSARKDAGWI